MWRKARSVISFSRVDIDGGDWTTKQTSLVVETGVVQQVVVAAFFPMVQISSTQSEHPYTVKRSVLIQHNMMSIRKKPKTKQVGDSRRLLMLYGYDVACWVRIHKSQWCWNKWTLCPHLWGLYFSRLSWLPDKSGNGIFLSKRSCSTRVPMCMFRNKEIILRPRKMCVVYTERTRCDWAPTQNCERVWIGSQTKWREPILSVLQFCSPKLSAKKGRKHRDTVTCPEQFI